MATRYAVICDGCDTEENVETWDGVPKSFVRAKVTVGSWGISVDVCTNCHERLLGNADPKRWARIAPFPPPPR